jgi:hypothetical protein
MTYGALGAWKYGAALNQMRLVTVLRKGRGKTLALPPVDIINLPVRSMGNLLMPVGVPSKARNRRPVKRLPKNQTLGPEIIGGHIDGKEIYQIEGAIPDRVGCWIEHPMGI